MGSAGKMTPLYDWHVANAANMASFGDYKMPLWYPAGMRNEHLAVINAAGIFDTSHMAVVTLDGAGARMLLQKCFSKDLENCIGLKRTPLVAGRSVYGLFLDERGHVIDDSIVSQVNDTLYMVVVNSGMGGVIAALLNAKKTGEAARVIDYTDRLGKVDIQGPKAARILAPLLKDESVFAKFPYFSFKGWFAAGVSGVQEVELADGTPIVLSRTGYTGEFGFEIFIAREKVNSLWEQLVTAGKDYGLLPCGLAARDSLRAGAVLPLSHQDIGDWPFIENPWSFAVADKNESGSFDVDFTGAAALAGMVAAEFTYPFAGFDPRKITASESSYVTDEKDERIGRILTCATDVACGRVDGKLISIATAEADGKPEGFTPKGISCGFVKVDRKLEAGELVFLVDGKRKIKVEIRKDIRPDRTARKPMAEMLV
ncbi:MAG: glycine cleavage system protein T [Desulfobacterales bacterium]|nr:MAG: glycine cleavage system protein T [Desulfobacterales bacterium]